MVNSTLSVIITNYNHGRFIGKALDAILSQSYKPTEVIIIDDASTDNSVEIIEQFISQYPIVRLIKNEKNMGIIHNDRRLFDLAHGDYVYIAGSDDPILPGFFEKSMNLLMQYPQAGLCSALRIIIDENDVIKGEDVLFISKKECFIPPDKALSIMRVEDFWVSGNTTIYKHKAFIESGGFISELGALADRFLQMVIVLKHGACFIPEPLACWRKLEVSFSVAHNTNPELYQNVLRNAVQLMKNKYNNLFPQDYIIQFQKEQLYIINSYNFLYLQRQKVSNLENLSPQTIFENVFLSIILLIMKLEFLFTDIYLYVNLKILGVALKRKLRRIFMRKFNMGYYCN